MRILIAEDDYLSRRVMMRQLKYYGDCDVAVDGVEALNMFMLAHDEGDPYGLISLDCMMPGLSGLDVLKAIRRFEHEYKIDSGRSVKVIMATALDQSKDILEAFKSQCEGYIIKPVFKEKLQATLEKLEVKPL